MSFLNSKWWNCSPQHGPRRKEVANCNINAIFLQDFLLRMQKEWRISPLIWWFSIETCRLYCNLRYLPRSQRLGSTTSGKKNSVITSCSILCFPSCSRRSECQRWAKTMKFVLKTRSCLLKTRSCLLKTRNCVLKTRNCALKWLILSKVIVVKR